MDKIEKKAVFGISLFIVLFILTIVFYRMYALREYKCTYAIYNGTEGSAWGKSKIITFQTNKGNSVKAEISYEGRLIVGDTVWIKYSTYDPEIVEVIDTDYKKYMKSR